MLKLHKWAFRWDGTMLWVYWETSSSGPWLFTVMEQRAVKEGRLWAHQSRIPRGLLFVSGGDPLHTDHFAKQILILPLIAFLFFTGRWRQLFFLAVGERYSENVVLYWSHLVNSVQFIHLLDNALNYYHVKVNQFKTLTENKLVLIINWSFFF